MLTISKSAADLNDYHKNVMFGESMAPGDKIVASNAIATIVGVENRDAQN
jgi:hypothetical protein